MQIQANFTAITKSLILHLLLAIFEPHLFAIVIMASTLFHNFF